MSPPDFPWHPLPSSPSQAICDVYLLQAGTLDLPKDIVLLPAPNKPNESVLSTNHDDAGRVFMPNYVFLLHHKPTGQHHLFDLGMRTDLDSLPPLLKEAVLPFTKLAPKNPADILRKHGSAAQQPEHVKSLLVSHLHFDHIGDGGRDFPDAELWIGPTACTYGRPGYPDNEKAAVLTDSVPTDGSRKIVEPFIPDSLLEAAGDARAGKVEQARKEGKYEAVELRQPTKGWVGLGAFDRGYDVFDDGSAYIVDAPGHCAGHQMMLVRVKIRDGAEDDFVVLAGDCFHQASLLANPELTARPPYSKGSLHAEPEKALETMWRTRELAAKKNIWVIGAHDALVGDAVTGGEKGVEGLVLLNDWSEEGWKRQ